MPIHLFKLLVYLPLLVFLFGCEEPLKKGIKQFEKKHMNEQVSKIRVLADPTPYLAIDSAKQIDRLWKLKIEALQQQRLKEQQELTNAREEVASIKSQQLKKIYLNQVDLMQERHNRTNLILRLYVYHPEKTGLGEQLKLKKQYENSPNDTLAYVLNANIKSKTGRLKSRNLARKYLIDKTQTTVLNIME